MSWWVQVWSEVVIHAARSLEETLRSEILPTLFPFGHRPCGAGSVASILGATATASVLQKAAAFCLALMAASPEPVPESTHTPDLQTSWQATFTLADTLLRLAGVHVQHSVI
eukprot:1181603-Prorocentrum_minimum.AAC.4